MEELTKQRQVQEQALTEEAAAGDGFKPGRKIEDCQGGGQDGSCIFLGKLVTPPKVLSVGASKWVDSNLEWLTSADELSEVLSAILDTAISKLADFTADAILDGGGSGEVTNTQDYTSETEQDLANLRNSPQDCYSSCFNDKKAVCISLDLNDSNPNSDVKQDCYARADKNCKTQCNIPQ